MNPDFRCPACGRESFLIHAPRYDGFRKVGEEVKCAACGRVFPEGEIPDGRAPARPAFFSDDDRPARPALFADEGPPPFCRRCRHYVVNPFRQWCGLHRREVDATDTCDRFEARPGADEGEHRS